MELEKKCIIVNNENNNNDGEKKEHKKAISAKDLINDKKDQEKTKTKKAFEKKCNILENKLKDECNAKKVIEQKYKRLVDKLRERTECPVCLEVPETGPVSACPNGHLVCSKCVGLACPTCRSKMFNGKSLLAVSVLENIEHKCLNKGCDQEFPLEELGAHKKACDFRLVCCPAILCDQKIAFCKLIDHVLKDCKCSYAKEDGVMDVEKHLITTEYIYNDNGSLPYNVDTYRWNGRYFFFNVEKVPSWTFHVEMLGSEEECSDYGFQLIVHRIDDPEAKGKYVYRLFGKPVPVEESKESKKLTGLMINTQIMEKQLFSMVGDDIEFSISIRFNKT